MSNFSTLKLLSLLSFTGLLSPQGLADTTPFTVKPKKCVTLHEGQMCYQHVTFQWFSDKEMPLCLYRNGTSKPMACAKESGLVSFTLDIRASREQQFELRNSSGSIISSKAFEVVSVYKGQRRATTGWRLF